MKAVRGIEMPLFMPSPKIVSLSPTFRKTIFGDGQRGYMRTVFVSTIVLKYRRDDLSIVYGFSLV